MKEPDVSVVVPFFNELDRVPGLREALLNQTLSPDQQEIILVDNGSTDGTDEELEEFARSCPHVRACRETERRGSYAARNRGVEQARGDLVAFTDADCRPVPEWLRIAKDRFDSGTFALAGGKIELTFRRPGSPNLWEALDASMHLRQQRYVEAGWAATSNLFVRRSCFREYGLFRDELQSGGDCEFGRRLTGAGETIAYLSDATVEHPARDSMQSMLVKEYRVGRGVGRLAREGALGWNPLSPGEWFPLTSASPGVGPSGDVFPVTLLGAANLLHYTNMLGRLKGFLRG